MHINNKCAWIEWFSVPNILLELHTGLTRQAIVKSRNVLKQYGLIDFRTNGTKATEYKMNTMLNSLQASLQVSCQDSLQGSLQDSLQVSCTLNKQNNTKQNNIDDAVMKYYLNNINSIPTPAEVEILESYAKELPSDLMVYAMTKAVENKARSLSYVKGILNSWKAKGITTLAQAKEEKQANNVIKLDWKGEEKDDYWGI